METYLDRYNKLISELDNQEVENVILEKLSYYEASIAQTQLLQDKNKIKTLPDAINGSIFDYKTAISDLDMEGTEEENDLNQSISGDLLPSPDTNQY